MRISKLRVACMGIEVAMVVAIAVAMLLAQVTSASAQGIKIRVGRTVGASGFHLPSYVAQDKGMFKEQGFSAEFIAAEGGVLVRAGIAKEIDYVPIPGGGTIAMLRGAPLLYVVGQSLISQWTITATREIKRVEDLKGKTIGLGRPGSADYEEATIVLGRFLKMELGKDYKVISFAGEPDRIAGMIGGSIDAAILSFPHAAAAEAQGFHVVLRTGDYIPRLGGTFFVHRDRIKERRDEVKRFIRAIARAADYVKTNKKGTVEVIQKWFGIKDINVAEGVYKQVQNAFGPEIPNDLLRILVESRATPEAGWPAGKPLPDIEQFVARDLLNETLKEMGRSPSK